MLKYKYVVAANGREMYYANGKMVKKETLPVSIVNMLEPGVELKLPSPGETEPPEEGETVDQELVNAPQSDSEVVSKDCIFCGKPGTRQRFVNLKIAMLCEEDYGTHTTGEIAAQLREFAEKE